MENILIGIINWIEEIVSSMGAWGIALLMAIESCNVPLPSEAILPFAGYLSVLILSGIFTGCITGLIAWEVIRRLRASWVHKAPMP